MKIEEVSSKIPSHGLCAKIARSPKYIRHFIYFGQRALANQNKSLLDLHHCHTLRMRQRHGKGRSRRGTDSRLCQGRGQLCSEMQELPSVRVYDSSEDRTQEFLMVSSST
eukprot:SAG11_NODE_1230_length_5458_cov_7.158798_3_plen_110_part_00